MKAIDNQHTERTKLMTPLPECITNRVMSMMSFSELERSSIWTKALEEKKAWVTNYFPSVISSIVGENTLLDAPIMPFRPEYLGENHSIECIPFFEMKEPIMVGVDPWDRSFVAVRTWSCGHYQVNVLYQKYSGIKTEWGHAMYSSYQFMPNISHHANVVLDQESRDIIHKLFCYRSIASTSFPFYQFMVV